MRAQGAPCVACYGLSWPSRAVRERRVLEPRLTVSVVRCAGECMPFFRCSTQSSGEHVKRF